MSKAKKITITLDDSDEPIEFYPSGETYLSITRGNRDKIMNDSSPDAFLSTIKEFNGVEVLLVIAAPHELKEEIVKAAMEIIDKVINT